MLVRRRFHSDNSDMPRNSSDRTQYRNNVRSLVSEYEKLKSGESKMGAELSTDRQSIQSKVQASDNMQKKISKFEEKLKLSVSNDKVGHNNAVERVIKQTSNQKGDSKFRQVITGDQNSRKNPHKSSRSSKELCTNSDKNNNNVTQKLVEQEHDTNSTKLNQEKLDTNNTISVDKMDNDLIVTATASVKNNNEAAGKIVKRFSLSRKLSFKGKTNKISTERETNVGKTNEDKKVKVADSFNLKNAKAVSENKSFNRTETSLLTEKTNSNTGRTYVKQISKLFENNTKSEKTTPTKKLLHKESSSSISTEIQATTTLIETSKKENNISEVMAEMKDPQSLHNDESNFEEQKPIRNFDRQNSSLSGNQDAISKPNMLPEFASIYPANKNCWKILSRSNSNNSNCVQDVAEIFDEPKVNEALVKSEDVEDLRKIIIDEIRDSFYYGTEDEFDCTQNEFDEVAANCDEIEKAVSEMQTQRPDSGRDETETMNTWLENEKIKNQFSTDNIKVFIDNENSNETIEDDFNMFGKICLHDAKDTTFLEAYNKVGHELVETRIGFVEHIEELEPFASDNEILTNDFKKVPQKEIFVTNLGSIERIERMIDDNSEDSGCSNQSLDKIKVNKLVNFVSDSSAVKRRENKSNNSYRHLSDSAIETCRSGDYDGDIDDSVENLSKQRSTSFRNPDKDLLSNRLSSYSSSNDSINIRNSVSNPLYDVFNDANKAQVRETFYDNYFNPRIEKVTSFANIQIPKDNFQQIKPPESQVETNFFKSSDTENKSKKEMIIDELVATEKSYCLSLEKIVRDYMPTLTNAIVHGSLVGKSPYIFGNIEEIYSGSKKLYEELSYCGHDHDQISQTFLLSESTFKKYPAYYKNKHRADATLVDFKDIARARQTELGDRLDLASYLLTPVQRLGKYIMLFEKIEKELNKENINSSQVNKALALVRKYMQRGNDFIAIDSIFNSPLTYKEHGSFLMQEKFNILKPKKYEAVLFLFEEILIFTVVHPKNSEEFIYRDSVRMDEMGIVIFEDEKLIFHIKCFSSSKRELNQRLYVIEARTSNNKEKWTNEIQTRLWKQLHQCKEIQKKMQSQQGQRLSTVSVPKGQLKNKSTPNSNRKKSQSTFYYDLKQNRQ